MWVFSSLLINIRRFVSSFHFRYVRHLETRKARLHGKLRSVSWYLRSDLTWGPKLNNWPIERLPFEQWHVCNSYLLKSHIVKITIVQLDCSSVGNRAIDLMGIRHCPIWFLFIRFGQCAIWIVGLTCHAFPVLAQHSWFKRPKRALATGKESFLSTVA